MKGGTGISNNFKHTTIENRMTNKVINHMVERRAPSTQHDLYYPGYQRALVFVPKLLNWNV